MDNSSVITNKIMFKTPRNLPPLCLQVTGKWNTQVFGQH